MLKIKDPIHRQKIALKAMDAILFGPSDHYKQNRMKDILLAICLVSVITAFWYAFHQKKESQLQMKKMLKDIDSLSKAEGQLQSLQEELDKARNQQEGLLTEKQKLEQRLKNEIERLRDEKQEMSSTSSLPNIHEFGRIQELEEELREAREQLSRANKGWTPPHQLQLWLQLTHELELKHYAAKKLAAEQQLAAAKDGVSSFLFLCLFLSFLESREEGSSLSRLSLIISLIFILICTLFIFFFYLLPSHIIFVLIYLVLSLCLLSVRSYGERDKVLWVLFELLMDLPSMMLTTGSFRPRLLYLR